MLIRLSNALRASDTRGGLEGVGGCWLKWSFLWFEFICLACILNKGPAPLSIYTKPQHAFSGTFFSGHVYHLPLNGGRLVSSSGLWSRGHSSGHPSFKNVVLLKSREKCAIKFWFVDHNRQSQPWILILSEYSVSEEN